MNSIIQLLTFKELSWEKIWLKVRKISYMESIIMYIIDIIIYFSIGIFIQSYQQSGLNFISFIKSFFVKISLDIKDVDNMDILLEEENEDNNKKFSNIMYHQEISNINKEKKEKNQFLKIKNINKRYNSLKAVDNFSVDLFPNEIFCLLGNNGAGKTTLINIISGIIEPTDGDILLNDISIIINKSYLYQNIGLCQQEDIYFDYLTVKEHLEFMYRIKGNTINRDEIEELMKKINLIEKYNSLCCTLSGGQKRKLSIALALIGNPKIVLLDEPTSGMDPIAKREIWKFLKDYKKDKIIILTTHSLDEAEYLGDKLGIIYDGHLVCSGTSSFLKSKYSCGFNINFIINSNIFNENNKQILFEKIKGFNNDAKIRLFSKGIFSINIKSVNHNNYEIFNYIEKSKIKIGINDYTINSTSLEDVFIKINTFNNLDSLTNINLNKENNIIKENMVYYNGFSSQLLSQIKRHLFPLLRNKTVFIIELISGLGFLYLLIIILSSINYIYWDGKKLILYPIESLNFIELLESNRNYVYEFEKDYLKKSDVYDNSCFITLKSLPDKPKDIDDFMSIAYNNSFANIAKSAIYLEKIENNDTFNLYITQTYNSFKGYIFANTMLFFSAYLKNEYNIDASIMTKIEFRNKSINEMYENNILKIYNKDILLLMFCIGSFIGFIIYLSGLIQEKIKERVRNIKHLLYLSGCNIWSYWISFYIVDFTRLMIFVLLLSLPAYCISPSISDFWINLIFVCISSLIFIYSISYFFSKEDSGTKFILLLFFIFIFIALILLAINEIILDEIIEETFDNYFSLFDFNPISSIIRSFFLLLLSNVEELFEKERRKYNFFFNILNIIGIQFINFVFYFILLILEESGLLRNCSHYLKNKCCLNLNIDDSLVDKEIAEISHIQEIKSSDKQNEKKSIVNNNPMNKNLSINNEKYSENNDNYININPLNNPYIINEIEKAKENGNLSTKIEGLNKTYWLCYGKNVKAINNLYLSLEPNEKFGLLGYNGSGKTTTFKAITNDILYDSGKISLFGYDNRKQFNEIRTNIGYCPQMNPLFDYMKVKEIIKFYLELKTSNETVESVCKKFYLEKYLDTYCINLSGGNKRKLTLAIALINRPNLLLLDEPSTGVDPLSKRIMWKNINELSNDENIFNMILITHSMEEAEILCDRVGWLKSGNFICIGNPEELKLQYSSGYNLLYNSLRLRNIETKFIKEKNKI